MTNLLKALAFLLFIAVALAQNIVISYPKSGAKVHAGRDLTVQIERPDTLTGSVDVSVAIGFMSCPGRPCLPASSTLGDVLFKGPYHPKIYTSPFLPYQNYSIHIPSSFQKGPAQINVAHFTLIGGAAFPFLDTYNTSIIIV